jgi:hypothetical protein
MGTDIHIVPQQWDEGQGKWVTNIFLLDPDAESRAYATVFAHFAVRNYNGVAEAPFAYRGLEGITELSDDGDHEVDGYWVGEHGHTWATLDELAEWFRDCEPSYFRDWVLRLQTAAAVPIRVLIGFDS